MFEPGKSGNPNGRPKGSLNKRTQAEKPIKQWFKDKGVHPLDFIMKCLDKQKSIIEAIEDPKEKFDAYNEVTKRALDILPYIAPKVKPVEESEHLETIDVTPQTDRAIQELGTEDLLELVRKAGT